MGIGIEGGVETLLDDYRLNVARELRNAGLNGLSGAMFRKEVQKPRGWLVHGLNGLGELWVVLCRLDCVFSICCGYESACVPWVCQPWVGLAMAGRLALCVCGGDCRSKACI